ncbi:hypothetical protein COW46_04285 [Candidatus Gracilibacteria bacterium CG17_big_fil_post_rev_8_21_14_2_50_48_13]|nr:MAG: hypothetical protein COW46_04285 [Candidatus Gracilibacteria bacterium CG17_big_fil_post_rev_8_21_14_2_50_48_13]
MIFSNSHKALAVSALSVMLLTSCGQPALNQNADPAQVLKDARTNLATSLSNVLDKTAAGTAKLSFDGTLENPEVNAKATGIAELSSNKANERGGMLNLNAEVTTPTTGKITGEVALEARTVGKMVYANLMKLSAKADQAELQSAIDSYIGMAALFTGKWMSLDPVALSAGASAEDMAAIDAIFAENDVESTKKMFALLKDHEIFTMKEKLADEDGMYVFKVVPNKEGILALMEASEKELSGASTMTPESKAQFEQVLDALSAENVTHKLYIDGDMHYRKFVSTGMIDSPEAKADITSTLTLDKDLNNTLVIDVVVTNPADAKQNMTISFKSDSKDLNGTFDFSFDAPFMTTKFMLKGTSGYKAGETKIEVPADAVDFTSLMGGMGASTGTTMPSTDMK